ncbi:LacI family DNA-binding transcriptional regulator [Undibacterium sp. 14-3-2]|uniref:LacI family DNA-binding transcriptional regulator n=1 Tax=Undibacterium sp. 14-3-2 TaxID=2800129 RepID=UPI0019035E59|nr:LacI family DNA-binding transcriptional regulator [Undibacterium sp. 14-3-2]MBK1889609.1 LacI family DNA-binding transcriptional regulator [Undibacterium sp. 14-3-2]
MEKSVVPENETSSNPVTLLDVAREAGVSPSTVSRILNGTATVSAVKRKAVEDAIKKMGFEPNPLAQSLKSGRSMTVGIVVQDISSPFFSEILRGVDDGLNSTGYASVIVSGHWNASEEAARIKLLLARKVDGLILLSGRIEDKAVLQFATQRPIVATGRSLKSSTAIGFKLDNQNGAYQAVRHLIELGHRRIAFVTGPSNNTDANERLTGYKQALESADIPFEPGLVVEGDFHEASGLMAVNRLFDTQQQFSAIFAGNDLIAYGVRLSLYRKGIRVPEDISLIGFDDLPGSLYTTPPLTTIRQPLYDMGLIATTALLGLIGGKPVDVELPPVELIVRETTRRFR